MKATVCTLFEGDYHRGLGALANSLCRAGYQGTVWAGYRGPLPPWAAPLETVAGLSRFRVGCGGDLCFIPVDTERHLTNHKPDFMHAVWRDHCPEADALFYFDPDIVLRCDWSFFEEWVSCGVALCEDICSPLHSTHPLRTRWRRYVEPLGFQCSRVLDTYVNAGFVGIARGEDRFLAVWQRAVEAMGRRPEGLQTSAIGDRTSLFYRTDQDALNVAVMASGEPLSIIGKEAMDFATGGYVMSHAIGSPKPWKKPFVRTALDGMPPSPAEKNYWQHVEAPIRLFPAWKIALKRLQLRMAAAIGRFVSRK